MTISSQLQRYISRLTDRNPVVSFFDDDENYTIIRIPQPATEIDHQDYPRYFIFKQSALINEGAYGKIYKAFRISKQAETYQLDKDRPLIAKVQLYKKGDEELPIETAKIEAEFDRAYDKNAELPVCDASKASYSIKTYIDGADLSASNENKGKLNALKHLSFSDRLSLIIDLLAQITLLHHKTPTTSSAIVHADTKPENIILVKKGLKAFVTLVDYGIANKLKHDSPDHTFVFSGVGSPSYHPIETLSGSMGLKTDVYVLVYPILRLLGVLNPIKSKYERAKRDRKGAFQVPFDMDGLLDPTPITVAEINISSILIHFLNLMQHNKYYLRPSSDTVLIFFNTLYQLSLAHNLNPANNTLKTALTVKLLLLSQGLWETKIPLVESGNIINKPFKDFDFEASTELNNRIINYYKSKKSITKTSLQFLALQGVTSQQLQTALTPYQLFSLAIQGKRESRASSESERSAAAHDGTATAGGEAARDEEDFSFSETINTLLAAFDSLPEKNLRLNEKVRLFIELIKNKRYLGLEEGKYSGYLSLLINAIKSDSSKFDHLSYNDKRDLILGFLIQGKKLIPSELSTVDYELIINKLVSALSPYTKFKLLASISQYTSTEQVVLFDSKEVIKVLRDALLPTSLEVENYNLKKCLKLFLELIEKNNKLNAVSYLETKNYDKLVIWLSEKIKEQFKEKNLNEKIEIFNTLKTYRNIDNALLTTLENLLLDDASLNSTSSNQFIIVNFLLPFVHNLKKFTATKSADFLVKIKEKFLSNLTNDTEELTSILVSLEINKFSLKDTAYEEFFTRIIEKLSSDQLVAPVDSSKSLQLLDTLLRKANLLVPGRFTGEQYNTLFLKICTPTLTTLSFLLLNKKALERITNFNYTTLISTLINRLPDDLATLLNINSEDLEKADDSNEVKAKKKLNRLQRFEENLTLLSFLIINKPEAASEKYLTLIKAVRDSISNQLTNNLVSCSSETYLDLLFFVMENNPLIEGSSFFNDEFLTLAYNKLISSFTDTAYTSNLGILLEIIRKRGLFTASNRQDKLNILTSNLLDRLKIDFPQEFSIQNKITYFTKLLNKEDSLGANDLFITIEKADDYRSLYQKLVTSLNQTSQEDFTNLGFDINFSLLISLLQNKQMVDGIDDLIAKMVLICKTTIKNDDVNLLNYLLEQTPIFFTVDAFSQFKELFTAIVDKFNQPINALKLILLLINNKTDLIDRLRLEVPKYDELISVIHSKLLTAINSLADINSGIKLLQLTKDSEKLKETLGEEKYSQLTSSLYEKLTSVFGQYNTTDEGLSLLLMLAKNKTVLIEKQVLSDAQFTQLWERLQTRLLSFYMPSAQSSPPATSSSTAAVVLPRVFKLDITLLEIWVNLIKQRTIFKNASNGYVEFIQNLSNAIMEKPLDSTLTETELTTLNGLIAYIKDNVARADDHYKGFKLGGYTASRKIAAALAMIEYITLSSAERASNKRMINPHIAALAQGSLAKTIVDKDLQELLSLDNDSHTPTLS